MYISIEDYTLDGEFLNRCKVKVNKEEIEMLEKNFKRAYWTWELPAAFRQHISVSMYMCTCIPYNDKYWRK